MNVIICGKIVYVGVVLEKGVFVIIIVVKVIVKMLFGCIDFEMIVNIGCFEGGI